MDFWPPSSAGPRWALGTIIPRDVGDDDDNNDDDAGGNEDDDDDDDG